MHLHEMPFRRCDGHGCGGFGDSRGARKHKGVDLACRPGTAVNSPVSGRVTKLGYPYGDDLSFRYVEISTNGYRYRVFYVEPTVSEGDEVSRDSFIGKSQSLDGRYSGITEHVHFEVMNPAGEIVDPTPIIFAQQR